MVEGQAVGDTSAAIVAHDGELPEPERVHHRHHVRGHRAFGVAHVSGVRGGLGRRAITAQIGANDGELLGQLRRDLAPKNVRLRIAVQQQYWRPRAADAAENFHLADTGNAGMEAVEHRGT